MALSWKGVFPALTTKFTEDDKLDLDLFATNIDAQISAGATGIILGGTLGESSTLTDQEKETLLQFSIAHVKEKVPVVMNIAEGATKDAIRKAKAAQDAGAAGLMLLPPMRYRTDHRETVTFFKEVAKATPLPIMIYNNPVDYKTEVSLDMFEELLQIDTIQAVKESTRDVSNVTRLRNRFGNRIAILCGVDTIAMEALLMGSDGWVAGLVCAFPKETVQLYEYVKKGEIDKALEIHRWFLPLLELDIHPKLVQYIKLAESKTGIGSENVRAPRLKLEGKEREEVLKIIEHGIATRPK